MFAVIAIICLYKGLRVNYAQQVGNSSSPIFMAVKRSVFDIINTYVEAGINKLTIQTRWKLSRTRHGACLKQVIMKLGKLTQEYYKK